LPTLVQSFKTKKQKNNTQKFKFTAEVELTPNPMPPPRMSQKLELAGLPAVRRQLKTNLRKIGVTAFVNFLGW